MHMRIMARHAVHVRFIPSQWFCKLACWRAHSGCCMCFFLQDAHCDWIVIKSLDQPARRDTGAAAPCCCSLSVQVHMQMECSPAHTLPALLHPHAHRPAPTRCCSSM